MSNPTADVLDHLETLGPREYAPRGRLQKIVGATDVDRVLSALMDEGLLTAASDDEVHWSYRLKRGRCDSRYSEGKRSWRCMIEAGHPGGHLSSSGGRRWR